MREVFPVREKSGKENSESLGKVRKFGSIRKIMSGNKD